MESWSDEKKAAAQHSSTPPLQDPSSYTPHTLRADLEQGRLPAARVLEIGLALTEALAHLHSHGLVHRDVKPSNVILVNGRPKLADIGLVTDASDQCSLVGTEGYLPPDGPGTPQADIFALGKVLYEALTGLDRRKFPELPEEFHAWTDARLAFELNEVILKACEFDSRQRYQSAEAIRTDLELLQHGQSVMRQRSWQRTLNRAKKLALALTALAFVSAIVYSLALVRSHSTSFKPSPIAEANEEYRIGMTALHFLEAENAIKHFQRAVNLDPKFAPAYAQMADAWISMGLVHGKQATAAAEKALQLDPNLGTAHAFFAHSKLAALDWSAAREHCTKALKLSPDSEEVLLACALMLSTMGFTNEATANLQRAIELGQDTPSRMRLVYSGFVYQWTRQYNHAIAIYNEASWGGSKMHEQQALAYLGIGDYPNAIRFAKLTDLERGAESTNHVNAEFDALEKAFKEGGTTNYWKLKLKYESPKNSADHWMRMAGIHARLNQRKEAFDYLRQAMKEAPAEFARGINRDPNLESLRTDQRFKDLLNELWRKK